MAAWGWVPLERPMANSAQAAPVQRRDGQQTNSPSRPAGAGSTASQGDVVRSELRQMSYAEGEARLAPESAAPGPIQMKAAVQREEEAAPDPAPYRKFIAYHWDNATK